MIKSFADLERSLKSNVKTARIAVVCAHEEHTLEAVIKAMKEGLVTPILIGNKSKIEEILNSFAVNLNLVTIINETDEPLAAQKAVDLVKNNQADFIMKGLIQTKNLLKAVVNKEHGLGTGSVMSHMAFNEVPNYHKLLVTTDGGMVMYPNLEQKRAVLENAVKVFNKLGYEKPNVAVLAAVEKVNPKMPETVDAAELKRLNQEGIIKNCIVEGPISYDLSLNKESAEIKNYHSEVTGEVDIFLVPNITVGNILGKSLIYSAKAKMAGLIVGAKVPIILTSRGATVEEKYLSIVLAVAVS
ncbi:bifunctional enoyl-CoA hydratase/phosphate acetyltransferase [Clostridium sp. 'deep sea']|uniref:bifunctional enoyl-CoA hydratase/phosphate acetyltransferase n=1 Tax=Clostridium sp. 'deep sea' TaxID=2779445 RepID=UPI001896867B|nr:bifunctional enoyl-CoA hydratase/phosphate acetyltransferase [Clostridium sp. 'deep sea']QOR36490.1 bifunctional enoyl-CoA hydratase/phosphate acetyltransferase [Clostridium sp. 'deep sea']